MQTRPGIKSSTRAQYEIDFRRHVEPYLGDRVLDRIEPEMVRRRNVELGRDLRSALAHTGRDGSATVARAYRMLRSILQTAVDDELLVRNPCRIAGAGETRSAERPVLSTPQIAALADEVPAHYRAFVVLAAFSGLRAGELAALRVADLELADTPSVRVSRRFYRVAGEVTVDAPKSARGFRTVAIPAFVATELRRHLAEHRGLAGKSDLVFVTSSGRDVLDGYSQVIGRALDRLGREDVRTHDLRHSPSATSTLPPSTHAKSLTPSTPAPAPCSHRRPAARERELAAGRGGTDHQRLRRRLQPVLRLPEGRPQQVARPGSTVSESLEAQPDPAHSLLHCSGERRPGDPQGSVRQETYLRALATLPNVNLHLGHFLTSTVRMPLAAPPVAGPRTVEVSVVTVSRQVALGGERCALGADQVDPHVTVVQRRRRRRGRAVHSCAVGKLCSTQSLTSAVDWRW